MKKLKNRMESITLSEEKKQTMIEHIRQAGPVPDKPVNRRLIGILSSAAVLVFLALAAVTAVTLPHRSASLLAPSGNASAPDKTSHAVQNAASAKPSAVREPSVNETSRYPSNPESVSVASVPAEVSGSSDVKEQSSVTSAPNYTESSTVTPEPSHAESSTVTTEPSQTDPSTVTTEPSQTESSTVTTEPSQTESSTVPAEPSENGDVSEPVTVHYVLPQQAVRLVMPEESPLHEFAGDMHRPEGYPEGIGSALALKLYYTADTTRKYAVVVRDWHRNTNAADSFDTLLNEANKRTDEPMQSADFYSLDIRLADDSLYPVSPIWSGYFAELSEGQLLALAESGAFLFYVGSGEGDYRAMNWDTPAGIQTFCELVGDEYIFRDGTIIYYPNI